MKYLQPLVILFFLALSFQIVSAQAPANDDCSGAVTITTAPLGTSCANVVSGTTIDATASAGATGCGTTSADDDVWYQFVASTASVLIRFENTVAFPSGISRLGLEVYEGSCGSLTGIYCNPTFALSNQFRIVDGLVAGNLYFVRIWTTSTDTRVSFDICIQDIPSPPSNDDCSGATTISPQPFNGSCTSAIAASTVGSTASAPGPPCGASFSGDDIWYSFTANSGSVILRYSDAVQVTTGISAQLGFSIHEGSCAATAIDCSGGFGLGSGAYVLEDLIPGTVYYLRFFSNGINNFMTFNFCLEELPTPPSNDECSNAILVTPTPFGSSCSSTISANTYGGTRSLPNPSCTGSLNGDDIWYRFVATSPAMLLRVFNAVRFSTGGSTQIGFALHEASCPATSETVACSNFVTAGSGFQIISGLSVGTEYFLRFWEYNTLDYASFEFCLQETQQPPNDECNSAIPITTQPVGSNCNSGITATTVGSTPSDSLSACITPHADDDIWYRFTSSTSGIRINFSNAVTVTATSGNGTIGYALYNATCPNSSEPVSCFANIGTGSGSRLVGGLVPGQEYLLRLYSYATNNYVSFDFCIVEVDLPLNDECINAIDIPVGEGFCTSPVAGSLVNATTTPGFGVPSCVPLSGSEDVWFKLTVPSSGNVRVQTSAVNSQTSDLVMEAWEGSCGNLSIIACDDDGNPEAYPSEHHSRIDLSGRTPGETIYLRVLSKGAINFGPFAICAWDTSIAAPISPGGNCIDGNVISIDESNLNLFMWVPVFDGSGNIIAEIYSNGNELGSIESSLFVNQSGTIREHNGKPYLDRNLSISPETSGPARVRVYFTDAELAAIQAADPSIINVTDLGITRTAEDCSPNFVGPVTAELPAIFETYNEGYYGEFSVTGFSSFFLNNSSTTLPLEFLYFSAHNEGDGVVLNWEVVKDGDIRDFSIEHSIDGSTFTEVATKERSAHIHESNDSWSYQLRDDVPQRATGFYRIRLNSIDGRVVYSKVIRVSKKGSAITIYPNPLNDVLTIRSGNPRGDVSISILNASGMEVLRANQTNLFPYTRLKVDALSSGMYILRITEKTTGDVHQMKFIKL